MLSRSEDSPPRAPASNEFPSDGWWRLASTCRNVASIATAAEALDVVLRAAVAATGSERAFLARIAGKGHSRKVSVLGAVTLRGDRSTEPSHSILHRACVSSTSWHCSDVQRDRLLRGEASVRALGVRTALAARLPGSEGAREVLVVDSAKGLGAPAARLHPLLESFAALAALLRTRWNHLPQQAADGAGPPDETTVGLVGVSRAFRHLLEEAARAASVRLPVLVTGESGTGKEGICRYLHIKGPRAEGPFQAVNCAAFPEALLESELFGAARGAYTGSDRDRPGVFQSAHGGTLLLDEVGEMSLGMQAKLLRALQEQRVRPVGGEREVEIDVRIVAATHRDLPRMVAAGAFRADLFYRLAVLELRVPALRERPDDLHVLAEHLLERISGATGLPRAEIEPLAVERLRTHAWPGNVRELEAVLTRAILKARAATIRPEDLEFRLATVPPERPRESPTLEAAMIVEALTEENGNVTRAAARIGWTRQKLYRRMAAFGIERPGAQAISG